MGEPDIFIKAVLVLGKDEIQVIIEFLFNSCSSEGVLYLIQKYILYDLNK